VFLVGGIISLILIPATRLSAGATGGTRDLLTSATAIGYLLVIARMGYLSALGDRRARWALFLLFLVAGAIAYVGIGLVLGGAPARPF
jgi:hypothetical protein